MKNARALISLISPGPRQSAKLDPGASPPWPSTVDDLLKDVEHKNFVRGESVSVGIAPWSQSFGTFTGMSPGPLTGVWVKGNRGAQIRSGVLVPSFVLGSSRRAPAYACWLVDEPLQHEVAEAVGAELADALGGSWRAMQIRDFVPLPDTMHHEAVPPTTVEFQSYLGIRYGLDTLVDSLEAGNPRERRGRHGHAVVLSN